MAGARELYIANIRTNDPDEPRLSFGEGLCRVRKGVFGLSDAAETMVYLAPLKSVVG